MYRIDGLAVRRLRRRLFVQNMVERNISMLDMTEKGVRNTGQPIAMSGGPAAIRTAEAAPR